MDDAERDYADMRRFQVLYMKADRELRELKKSLVPDTVELTNSQLEKITISVLNAAIAIKDSNPTTAWKLVEKATILLDPARRAQYVKEPAPA